MTISLPDTGDPASDPAPAGEATVIALRRLIFGEDYSLHTKVRDAVLALGDVPESGTTYSEEAAKGPALLRRIVPALGGSAWLIAADPWLRGALCEWAAVAAPRLLPVLSGHFDLALGAMSRLANDSTYQQHCLSELDRVSAVGALLHTELAGTNGPDGQTVATWHPDRDCFTLTTPHIGAAKFMPNVAAAVPKTVIVTARLIVNGRDEGVFPFLVRLRTLSGPARGVDIVALSDKVGAPMDHALIRFQQAVLPREALLGGDWARIDDNGRLVCELDLRERFHASIRALQAGRIDLANASVASARAALALLVNHARQRRPAGIPMMQRDAVRHDMVSAVAAVYAVTALGAEVRDRVGAGVGVEQTAGLWTMLAKPLLSDTARRVLAMCRRRSGAHGALRINYIADWEGLVEGVVTAEGENQVLAIAAGRLPRQVVLGKAPAAMDISALSAWESPADPPWWTAMLRERELGLAAAMRAGRYDAFGAIGPDSLAVQMAGATAERLASDCLAAAASRIDDHPARSLVDDLGAVWALEQIKEHGLWHTAHGQLTPQRAALVDEELGRRRSALADHLPGLVAAFAIPELPAPMSSDDYLGEWARLAAWEDLHAIEPPEVDDAGIG